MSAGYCSTWIIVLGKKESCSEVDFACEGIKLSGCEWHVLRVTGCNMP